MASALIHIHLAHSFGVGGEPAERESSKSLQATLTQLPGVTTIASWLVSDLFDSLKHLKTGKHLRKEKSFKQYIRNFFS